MTIWAGAMPTAIGWSKRWEGSESEKTCGMAKGRGAEPRSVASLSHGRLMVGHYVHHNLMLANLVPNELHCDIVPDCPDGLVMLVIVVFLSMSMRVSSGRLSVHDEAAESKDWRSRPNEFAKETKNCP
eukprot:CAMPEP_0181256686 /NCGR_PEP_ID=MMETSP1096-20121128/49844_1 /TAXON_ID=156174 ORGANISM="Chrysochromulina ericina, Strain CCMP281" /NCGR_SAMPLE_ID=MMETSP1096 /ASSEMBLY_ACC=CAM_ASM_000453 /LENGTH=127 /DNA_ID=CAMNT_0023354955 /DNA_START=463 /DNA_END=847 /DNA_ORIENTATION=+